MVHSALRLFTYIKLHMFFLTFYTMYKQIFFHFTCLSHATIIYTYQKINSHWSNQADITMHCKSLTTRWVYQDDFIMKKPSTWWLNSWDKEDMQRRNRQRSRSNFKNTKEETVQINQWPWCDIENRLVKRRSTCHL